MVRWLMLLPSCHTGHMLIRPASMADVPAIVDVHIVAWDAVKGGLDVSTRRTPEERTDVWTTFLERGEGALLIAEDHGAVRGFIAFGPSRDADRHGEMEVYTLYVDPPCWDRGIGSALMAEVPAEATVSLWVSELNSRAREFYQSRGFTPDGAREMGHHVPVIRLVRTQG